MLYTNISVKRKKGILMKRFPNYENNDIENAEDSARIMPNKKSNDRNQTVLKTRTEKNRNKKIQYFMKIIKRQK